MFSLTHKCILILGMGKSGCSAYQFVSHLGASKVCGIDRVVQKGDYDIIHEHEPIDFSQWDLLVLSPGIHPTHNIVIEARKAGLEIVGEMELACRYLTKPMLGITGTNGKTTVTLCVEHILKNSGRAAKAVGNIGVPLTSMIFDEDIEILVTEFSSFQLETLHSQVLDAAIVLNITEDHLDRYGAMKEYARAKLKIRNILKPNAPWFISRRAFDEYHDLIKDPQPTVYGFSSDCDVFFDGNRLQIKEKIESISSDDYKNKFDFEVENMMASLLLCREMGITKEAFWKGAVTFKKPSHRLEFVCEIEDVKYWNDSKATNVDAVMKALESIQGNIILIVGGRDKGGSFDLWKKIMFNKVRSICVIGEAKDKFMELFEDEFLIYPCETMDDAVNVASSLAFPGDNVLLSPGCASYDMYSSYVERGESFKSAVRKLHNEVGSIQAGRYL